LATLRADVLMRTGKVEEAAALVPALADAEDDASRIYLANLRRKIALARGDQAGSAEMERDISSAVDRMISGWPELRGPLLASPAYAELTFLQRPARVAADSVVRGQSEHMEPVIGDRGHDSSREFPN